LTAAEPTCVNDVSSAGVICTDIGTPAALVARATLDPSSIAILDFILEMKPSRSHLDSIIDAPSESKDHTPCVHRFKSLSSTQHGSSRAFLQGFLPIVARVSFRHHVSQFCRRGAIFVHPSIRWSQARTSDVFEDGTPTSLFGARTAALVPMGLAKNKV
jgi:hypothetical protein